MSAHWTGLLPIAFVYSTAKKQIHKSNKARMKLAGKLVAKVMRKEIPRGPTGNLKKSVSWEIKSDRGVAIDLEVGTSTNRKGPHGHLINDGTDERVRASGGETGSVRANPFIARTASLTDARVMKLIGGSLKVF